MIIKIIRGNAGSTAIVEKKYKVSDSSLEVDGAHIDFENINNGEDNFTLIIAKESFEEIFKKGMQGFTQSIKP